MTTACRILVPAVGFGEKPGGAIPDSQLLPGDNPQVLNRKPPQESDTAISNRIATGENGMSVEQTGEEQFDVVDERDQVLYSLPRSEVHRRRLRHRAVHIFLLRPDGQLLIHKRSAQKEEFPSVWTSSASGHVTAGESYDACAPRELQEELGVTAPLQRLQYFPACEETSREFTVLYQACSSAEICFDRQEMTEIRWMPPQRIADWIATAPGDFSPAFLLLFDWYRRQSTTTA